MISGQADDDMVTSLTDRTQKVICLYSNAKPCSSGHVHRQSVNGGSRICERDEAR